MKNLGAGLSIFFALILSGCATDPPAATPTPGTSSPSRPAAPRYNLTGYSKQFKEGYSDACATPRRRSEQRFKNDTDYQMGWQDGSSVCRGR
jgi:hypothetical protein